MSLEEFFINELKSIDDIKKLFIEKWNWESPSVYEYGKDPKAGEYIRIPWKTFAS